MLDAEVQPDGLWITLRATERGNRVLETNPGLSVSAGIVEGYERSDGQSGRPGRQTVACQASCLITCRHRRARSP